ncbi:MAG: ATP-binding protein [Sphingomonadales bacterium]|jgi:energy-coupling factor transporter ATP-binding protein EcfA2
MSQSPFKFLDPYGPADRDRFFGREREVEQLALLLTRGDIVLLYGGSGTGKTSLIQCGLASLYRAIDWLPVTVRRNGNINDNLLSALRDAAQTPIPAGATLVAAVKSLYLDHLRPVHLVLDQFEEVLLAAGADERDQLFRDLADLLAAKTGCKILISMREEYFALLSAHEDRIPQLFDHRLRVEPMTPLKLQAVIVDLARASGVALAEGAATANAIVTQLGTDQRGAFQLPYLQIYLDRLWRNASDAGGPPGFSLALIARTGSIEHVLAQFLDEQIDRVAETLAQRAGAGELASGTARPHPRSLALVLHAITAAFTRQRRQDAGERGRAAAAAAAVQTLLEQFVTADATRQAATVDDVCAHMTMLPPGLVRGGLDLFVQGRILRPSGPDRFELAHDSLAALIDGRRSADSRNLAQVTRMIRYALAREGEVKTPWLTPEELVLADAVRSRLVLTDKEREFLARSRQFRRRERLSRIGRYVLAVLAILIALITILITQISSEEIAKNELNTLVGNVYEEIRLLPETGQMQDGLMSRHKAIEERLSTFWTGTHDDFWRQIHVGDTWREKRDFARAAQAYDAAAVNAASVDSEATEAGPWQGNIAVARDRQAQVLLDAAFAQRLAGGDLGRAAASANAAVSSAGDFVAISDVEEQPPADEMARRRQIAAHALITRLSVRAVQQDFAGAARDFQDANRMLQAIAKKDRARVAADQALLNLRWAQALRRKAASPQGGSPADAEIARQAIKQSIDQYETLLKRVFISSFYTRRVAEAFLVAADIQLHVDKDRDGARQSCKTALDRIELVESLETQDDGTSSPAIAAEKARIVNCWGLGPIQVDPNG